MNNRNFMKLDNLDKFLTMYMKILNDSIDTAKDEIFKNIYIKERSCILSIVEFIRHIENLSEEELFVQLKEFETDPNLKDFIIQITSTANSKIDMKTIKTKELKK